MKNFELSRSEELVFEIICEQGSVSMAEIIRLVQEKTDWKTRTIKTFVMRMVEKGALAVQNDTVKKYYPTLSRNEYRYSLQKNMCENQFDGSSKAFVLNVIVRAY